MDIEPRQKQTLPLATTAVSYPVPQIPDHQLLRCIGSGSYGEVWLASSVMESFRAIKIIDRRRFPVDRPFDREFTGIKKFEPISRTHPGLVSILHVGRNSEAGYFYYVMEIGDDVECGQAFSQERYKPKTLASELADKGSLPLEETIKIGQSLAVALEHLHSHGLVHRDVKPSNIIFVHGTPKFADIGLVSDIGESATFVGTEGYVPPEGPGKPSADLYALGKVLYQIGFGRSLRHFPELPTDLDRDSNAAQLRKLYQVVLKACDLNPRKRFQTGQEMAEHLGRVLGGDRRGAISATAVPRIGTPVTVAIIHHPDVSVDDRLAKFIEARLTQNKCLVTTTQHAHIGVEWAREVENKIVKADIVIALLSPSAIQSEMVGYELEMAHDAAHQHEGKPRLIAVRVQLSAPLPSHLARNIAGSQSLKWERNEDDERLASELVALLSPGGELPAHEPTIALEAVGGAVPLDSNFYVVRPADEQFRSAMLRNDSIILVKGARQMGKTSLLARGLEQARAEHLKVVSTDFQELNATNLDSLEKFYLTLCESLAVQLDLDVFPHDVWNAQRSPNTNFERYLRREVLDKLPTSLVWGMDEVDRLFTASFGSEVFGLFRSWHNKRALDPDAPWAKLTLVIAYATEAHLFITDMNQSPFNVGTRLVLEDFTAAQVAELNTRYGNPIQTPDELDQFIRLLGGQPFLVRCGLNEIATRRIDYASFEAQALKDDGVFGDHLRRLLVSLAKDAELTEIVRGIIRGQPCPGSDSFYRLRSAGLMIGDSPATVRPRCQLYAEYLNRHLLSSK